MGYDSPEQRRRDNARYYERHKERLRAGRDHRAEALRSRYGMTTDEYDAMLAEQGGHCALCPTVPGARRLHVDHDHATGKVRGLLCLPCNGALHYLEREGWLPAALHYLNR